MRSVARARHYGKAPASAENSLAIFSLARKWMREGCGPTRPVRILPVRSQVLGTAVMAAKLGSKYAAGMFAHIQLGVRDLKAMTAFYDAVLGEVGLSRVTDLAHVGPAGVIWRSPGSRWPQFVINLPFDGMPSTTANGSQVSFLCASRSEVDAAWSVAISQSATDLGAPGVRARYAADFYAAYCLDPEGNKLCFVHTDPKP